MVDLIEDVVIHPHRTVIDHRCGPAQRKSVQSKMTTNFYERWPRLRTSKMPQQYHQCCVSTIIPGPTSVGKERLADDKNIFVMSGAIDDIRGRLESWCEGLAAQHTVPTSEHHKSSYRTHKPAIPPGSSERRRMKDPAERTQWEQHSQYNGF